MRKLKTRDIPAFSRCLKKLGLKEQFKSVAKEADSVKDVWDKGYDLIWGLFDTATEITGENILYEFLAGPLEMAPEEVADLDMATFLDYMKIMASENNLTAFFKSAAELMK